MKYKPPVGSSDANASYVNADIANGVQGSIPDAKAIEHPMREILAVITAAGLTPSESDLTQLNQAILKHIQTNSVSVPDATTAVKGAVELATQGEANAGTDTTRAITSAVLKAMLDLKQPIIQTAMFFEVHAYPPAISSGVGVRTFNVTAHNDIPGLTLSGDTLTIPPGVFIIDFEAIGRKVDAFHALLIRADNNAINGRGMSMHSSASDYSAVSSRLIFNHVYGSSFAWKFGTYAARSGSSGDANSSSPTMRVLITKLKDA